MRIIIVIVCTWLAVQAPAQTNDTYPVLQTLDGQRFTNAEISSVTAAYAIVFYGDGSGAKIALTNLPDELQRKYHFDSIAAAKEVVTSQDKKLQTLQAQDDYLAATQKAREDAVSDKLYRIVEGQMVLISNFQRIQGEVSKVVPGGILCVPFSHKAGPRPVITENQKEGGYIGAAGIRGSIEVPGTKTVFIHCPIGGIADGQRWEGYCYRVGTVATNGSTLEKYQDTGLSYVTRSPNVLTGLRMRSRISN